MTEGFIHKWLKVIGVFILFASSFTGRLSIQSASAALKTIDVEDGSVADWSGVLTAFSDGLGDNSGNSYDLSKVYLTNDASNLYVRWDIANKPVITSQVFTLAIVTNRSSLDTTRPATPDTRIIAEFGSDSSIAPEVGVFNYSTNTLVKDAGARGRQIPTGSNSSSIEVVVPFSLINQVVSTKLTGTSVAPLWAGSLAGNYKSSEQDTIPDSGYLDWNFADASYTPVGTGPIPSLDPMTTIPIVASGGTAKYKVTVSNAGDNASGNKLDIQSIDWTLPEGFTFQATDLPKGYITKSDGTIQSITFTSPPANAAGKLTWSGFSVSQLSANEALSVEFSSATNSVAPGQYYSNVVANVKTSTKGSLMEILSGDTAMVTILPGSVKPADLTANSTTLTSTELSWSGVSGATGYNVYQNGILINSRPVSTNSFSVTDLLSGTSYTYEVTAILTDGESSPSNALTVLTLPDAPVGLTAVSNDTNVQLTWNAVEGATGYHLYQNGLKITTSPVTDATTYQVTGLTSDFTYSFAVSAVHSGGESTLSTPVSVTTLSEGPLGEPISPKISYTLSTSTPTTSPVKIMINVVSGNSESQIIVTRWAQEELSAEGFKTEGQELVDNNFFYASENGTYYVYAEDQEGLASIKPIVISNIDMENPLIHYEWSSNDSLPIVHVSVVADGTGTEIAELKVKNDLEQSEISILNSKTFEITKNVPYTIYARDEAGNETILPLLPMGDVDLSKQLNVTDWVEVINYILNRKTPTEMQRMLADMNRDQEINVADPVIIANMIMK